MQPGRLDISKSAVDQKSAAGGGQVMVEYHAIKNQTRAVTSRIEQRSTQSRRRVTTECFRAPPAQSIVGIQWWYLPCD